MAQSQSSGSDAGKTVYLPAVVSQSNTATDLVPQTPDQYNATSTEAPNAQVGAATYCSSYIYFSNQSSYTVKIYWVDSWGNEVLYYTLSSQQAYWQQSYYGHKWRIRSTSGTLLKEALTSSCFNMTVNIYNSDFPPTPTPVPPTPTNTPVPPTPTPGSCVPCAKGVTNMTLQLAFRVSTGDRNERIRVRADSLTGQVLYDTWNDAYPSDSGLPVGATFSFNVPAAATQVAVTVQGANHPSETLKATFSTECNLVIGSVNGNSYIQFAVSAATFDGTIAYPGYDTTPVLGRVYKLVARHSGQVMDVNGAGGAGTQVIQYPWNSGSNQKWTFSLDANGYYVLTPQHNTGLRLNVNGASTASGAAIIVWGSSGATNEEWSVTSLSGGYIQLTARHSGLSASVSGASTASGASLVQSSYSGASSQQWQLVPVTTPTSQSCTPTPTPTNTPVANTASLGDRVWNDANRNGLQDSGEAGVPNVVVTLLSGCSGNTIVNTTFTNASGIYGFSNLAAGQYRVQMTLPSGYQFSSQNQGANDAADSDVNTATGISDCITLTAGQNDPNWDAGINQPAAPTPTNTPVPPTPTNTPVPATACLGDRTWVDSNGNGVQDAGEANLPGVTIKLWTDNDGNGTPDTQVGSTTSDANGAYQFCSLTPGVRYIVQFITPAGYNLTTQASPSGSDATNSDPSPNNGGYTDVIVLAANQNNPNIDAGFVSNTPVPTPTSTPVANTASLGDRVWNDANRNGIQDSGEAGVPNVTVTLFSGCSGNTVVGTTITDATGIYGFSNLAAGQYRVQMSLPSGYQFSQQNQGSNDTVDSDVNTATGISDCITLAAGQNDPNWDAGINQPPAGNTVSIGDKVWLDLNRDGLQDPGEVGIANVTIKLYCANTGGTLVATTTTDANGNYLFTGLDPACTYVIQVTPPYGRGFTLQDVGTDNSRDSDVDPNNGYSGGIDVPAGQSDLTIDIGMIIVEDPVIGDRVWNDSNANGIQDAGELGVSNVTVKLYDGASQLLRTTVTDVDGFYLFDNLPNGSYQVQFVLPAGYVFSPQDQGGNDTFDSDANPATGYTVVVTLNGTVVDLSWDAGIHK